MNKEHLLDVFARLEPNLNLLMTDGELDSQRVELREKLALLRASVEPKEIDSLQMDIEDIAAEYLALRERLQGELLKEEFWEEVKKTMVGIAISCDLPFVDLDTLPIHPKQLIIADVINIEDVDRGVTMKEGGVTGAKSIKLRNLLFNSSVWPYLFGEVTLNVTAIPSIPAIWPLLALAAGILLFRSFRDAATVDLSILEATVLWSLMKDYDMDTDEETGLLKFLNAERRIFGLSGVTKCDLVESLHRLEEIGCIELINGKWRVIEDVYVKDDE